MTNIFIKIILILSFGLVSLNASNTVKKEFNDTFDSIIEVVKDSTLTKEERNKRIIDTINPIFDFELMAKLSLGKTWKQLSKDTQEEFVSLYVKRMKNSYSAKIDGYADEKVIINDITQPKSTRMVFYTSLVGDNDSINIEYKYYKTKIKRDNKKVWLIYDVVIEGISILKTDRAQFSAVLKRGSIESLMQKLRG